MGSATRSVVGILPDEGGGREIAPARAIWDARGREWGGEPPGRGGS